MNLAIEIMCWRKSFVGLSSKGYEQEKSAVNRTWNGDIILTGIVSEWKWE